MEAGVILALRQRVVCEINKLDSRKASSRCVLTSGRSGQSFDYIPCYENLLIADTFFTHSIKNSKTKREK